LYTRSRGCQLVPYMEQVCTALDLTLHLGQKDEYELAHSVLQSLLVWLTQPRLVELEPRQPFTLAGWGRTLPLDSMRVDWYLPAAQELGVVRGLTERYLLPLLASLDRSEAAAYIRVMEELGNQCKVEYSDCHIF
jgi:hypothetical protein